MANKVFYDDDARRRVLEGARILYEAVKTTMGPKGRNVVIDKSYGSPTVTHDGVTVAKGVEIPEAEYDDNGKLREETLGYKVGAELIKQAANKMNDVAGDGTTSVTVLTYHLLSEANRLIAAGHSPMELRKGVEEAGSVVLKALEDLKEDIGKDKEKIANVATISAGDREIGKLIAKVIDAIGKDGVVTVEEGQSLDLEHDVVKGFTMDRGFVSPFMATDATRMEAVIDKPAIIITDKKISSAQEFLPVLEQLAQAGKKDVLIIADDVEGEVLGVLILNKLKGVLNAVAVKAPSFGDRRKETLEDIAVLTGGQVISEEKGDTFENVEANYIGSARKVIVTKDETTIIEGAGSASALKSRIAQITSQGKASSSEYEKENYDARRAALQGKVAVIKVGGATETEIEEKKFRVDDAVAATKAALSEGIVPGGGVAFVRLSKKITEKEDTSSRSAGFVLVRESLKQPFLQLLSNAGVKSPDSKLEQLINATQDWEGFDVSVSNPELESLKEKGIIDPALVTREVIRNAISIAGTAMTMGALVAEVPKKEEPAAGGGMPGGGMMGM